MNNFNNMASANEQKKNSQAAAYTAIFAGILILMMFLLSWTIPTIPPPPPDEGVTVELNIPEEEILPPARATGGGGGGNPVQASGEKGTASSPPAPGTEDEAKDIDEDADHTSPAILKPDVPKPTAPKINENKSVVKTEPKVIPVTPAPQKPKAVLGKTTSGNSTGGGAETTYDRSGGSGSGNGVGNGSGNGGGRGTGNGGGTGSGTGTGSGPRVTKGDRSIIQSYAFRGNLDRATIYAEIKVAANGVGTFVSFARGSTATSSAYKNAIVQYLRNMKFNTSDHESTVTVLFNFVVDG